MYRPASFLWFGDLPPDHCALLVDSAGRENRSGSMNSGKPTHADSKFVEDMVRIVRNHY